MDENTQIQLLFQIKKSYLYKNKGQKYHNHTVFLSLNRDVLVKDKRDCRLHTNYTIIEF